MENNPYKTIFETLPEVSLSVGKEIGISPWVSITQKDIDAFAQLTDDEQWLHVDAERTKTDSPYGTTIAHGYLVLSMASRFVRNTMEIKGLKMVINYGSDRVRFPHATPVDSEIRGHNTILEYSEKRGMANIKIKMTIRIKGVRKPACVAELIAICIPEE